MWAQMKLEISCIYIYFAILHYVKEIKAKVHFIICLQDSFIQSSLSLISTLLSSFFYKSC